MNFVILPSEGTMSVDNLAVEFNVAQWIPDSSIEIVAWHGDTFDGFIERNDRPRITERIDNLSVYRDVIDVWMAAAASLPQALTLEQARRIKCDMVDALYHYKRTRPFSDGVYNYDGSDEAVGCMAALVACNKSVGEINTALGAFLSQYNNNVVNVHNAPRDTVANWSAWMAYNWAVVDIDFGRSSRPLAFFGSSTRTTGEHQHDHPNNSVDARAPHYPIYIQPVGSGGLQQMGGPDAHISVPSVGGNVMWQPIGYPNPISISIATLASALAILVNYRNRLNEQRVAKKSEINGPTVDTMAKIIAFDVTAGW